MTPAPVKTTSERKNIFCFKEKKMDCAARAVRFYVHFFAICGQAPFSPVIFE